MAMPDGNEQERARGRDALHGLGVDPVPEDAAARLQARLDLELPVGRAPAERSRRPRRRLGLLLGAPIAATAAIVGVLLIGSSETSPKAARPVAASVQLDKSAAGLRAAASAAVGSRACPKGEVRRRARPGAPARCRPRHHGGR
jgi:hypothetical protein